MALSLKVLEECQISPPTGSVSTTTSLPLTFFDLPWLVMSPVERLFFFEFNHPSAHFLFTILPMIKDSLSLALQHYYPLAGNLTWPQHSIKPEILYTPGDSILLIVAESDQNFQHLSGNHAHDASEFYPLVPKFKETNLRDKLVPLLVLQVTLFPEQGVCIGIMINHAVADGRTSNQFVKLWASLCPYQLGGEATEFTVPRYDRSIVKDPKEIEMILLNDLAAFKITKDRFNSPRPLLLPDSTVENVRVTFTLGHSEVVKLKRGIMICSDNVKQSSPQLHLSTFVVTCAYVWVCMVKSKLDADDTSTASEDQKEHFGFPMDGRAQVTPALPLTYFGNCLGFCIVTSTRKDWVQEDGISVAAAILGNGIQSIREPDEFFKPIATLLSAIPYYDLKNTVSVAGSPKLSVYETDFGWGKPKKVEIISIEHSGAISISEHPNEEGAIEIGLVRDRKQIDAFATFFVNHIKSLP